MSGRVYPLKDNQALAVDPRDSVWLSASAGTGKTQVLSARVLRLLLEPGVRPEQILCLTFTKAGAAEMAVRVNEVLANWVRMPDEQLFADLRAIGSEATETDRDRARTLFASVLDCPGGGLRIDTIHAFAQWLLSAFPEEANLAPGTRAMEDRDRDLLAGRTLRALVEQWEENDPEAMAALEMLSLRLSPDGARQWLMRCAGAHAAFIGPGAWQPPMRERVAMLLGLAPDLRAQDLAGLCADGTFDCSALREVLATYHAWGTVSAGRIVDPISAWLAAGADQRLVTLSDLHSAIFNAEGVPKYATNAAKHGPDLLERAEDVRLALEAIIQQAVLLELVDFITPALELGRRFALAWDEAKAREGLVDFDDLIRQAAGLLGDSNMAGWIRYKLDRRFDHILVDEAQDTNPAQWDIIRALTDDFFAGLGQAGEKTRTLFVVGDYKQAIFGFQGTSPRNFAEALAFYKKLLAERAENARLLRDTSINARALQDLDLGRSYRTAQDILTFVDEAVAAIGPQNIGLEHDPEPHIGDANRPGLVNLWRPVPGKTDDNDSDEDGPEIGVSGPEREMANRIAKQVAQWLANGFPLVKGEHRNAGPGDVMVLVRQRKELANLIVARLHAAGVPVAGVDRLRLGAPLAVKDLMAALRFAVQPGDDLSLACLLVSPLMGWSQDELLRHGFRDKGVALWDHLRRSDDPFVAETASKLRDLLALADYEPPQALLHWMLLGPWRGRARLIARLGSEAGDPIDELLGAALQFSASHTLSLQGFIHWFDAGEGELKREAEGGGGLVRVMTVHGSKGLQAPIVILADACGDPDRSTPRGLELEEQVPGRGGKSLPLPSLPKDQRAGPIADAFEAAKAEDLQEHWRLLYVAMTRAEEALFIGGALGKGVPLEKGAPKNSWYARLEPLFGDSWLEDDLWGARAERGGHADPVPAKATKAKALNDPLPEWVHRPIEAEPRPPRPLAPSSLGEEVGADPPLPVEAARIAARRGVLIHALLERLPDVPAELRQSGGRAWLARHADEMSQAERDELLEHALAVLAEPGWTELFAPGALAEVPIAAVVGERVIAGTIDRLLITADKVLVVDFKTARRPPASLAEVPVSTLKQMAAYAAALEVIYPGKRVEAALLYTQTPRLIALPPETLSAHKPNLTSPEESYSR